MHTHEDHGGAYFFSLPIRCEESHVSSPDCHAVGLLTLGWSTVPPHIPRCAICPFAVQWGCTAPLPSGVFPPRGNGPPFGGGKSTPVNSFDFQPIRRSTWWPSRETKKAYFGYAPGFSTVCCSNLAAPGVLAQHFQSLECKVVNQNMLIVHIYRLLTKWVRNGLETTLIGA